MRPHSARREPAEIVSIETKDALRLDGTLRIPERGAVRRWDADLVICHHGQGGNFYGGGPFAALTPDLLAASCAVLRVNSRGHDQVYTSPKGRLGSAFEHVDDCRIDWRAWLDFAEAAGYQRVWLWAHSLGSVKTLYFLGRYGDPRVRGAICSSPPRWSYDAYRNSEDGAVFEQTLAEANRLVAAGQPAMLLETSMPVPGLFAAGTYADKYGPASPYDYLKHLPEIQVPLLITLGGLEGGHNYGELGRIGPTFHDSWPRVSYAAIDGADHFYTGRAAELWSAISDWLDQTAPAER